jgi:hypothetical protein
LQVGAQCELKIKAVEFSTAADSVACEYHPGVGHPGELLVWQFLSVTFLINQLPRALQFPGIHSGRIFPDRATCCQGQTDA